jgi:hypothetical protein
MPVLDGDVACIATSAAALSANGEQFLSLWD